MSGGAIRSGVAREGRGGKGFGERAVRKDFAVTNRRFSRVSGKRPAKAGSEGEPQGAPTKQQHPGKNASEGRTGAAGNAAKARVFGAGNAANPRVEVRCKSWQLAEEQTGAVVQTARSERGRIVREHGGKTRLEGTGQPEPGVDSAGDLDGGAIFGKPEERSKETVGAARKGRFAGNQANVRFVRERWEEDHGRGEPGNENSQAARADVRSSKSPTRRAKKARR